MSLHIAWKVSTGVLDGVQSVLSVIDRSPRATASLEYLNKLELVQLELKRRSGGGSDPSGVVIVVVVDDDVRRDGQCATGVQLHPVALRPVQGRTEIAPIERLQNGIELLQCKDTRLKVSTKISWTIESKSSPKV